MTKPMKICMLCGRQTTQETCPDCKQQTVPRHLTPAHCLVCGVPLTLPLHLRTLPGLCEDCTDTKRTAIGLWAWDALLCDLI